MTLLTLLYVSKNRSAGIGTYTEFVAAFRHKRTGLNNNDVKTLHWACESIVLLPGKSSHSLFYSDTLVTSSYDHHSPQVLVESFHACPPLARARKSFLHKEISMKDSRKNPVIPPAWSWIPWSLPLTWAASTAPSGSFHSSCLSFKFGQAPCAPLSTPPLDTIDRNRAPRYTHYIRFSFQH